jgi:acid phosphatase family membrane protein YuiD
MYNTGIEVLVAATTGTVIAQLLKFVGLLLFKKRLNYRLLVETGGMPSSHSATVSAMSTSVGLITGFDSVAFSIALSLALIVMYDAAGVRRAAGRMAGILNQLTEDLYTHHPDKLPERLKELLGHTPYEVLAGATLGIVLSLVLHQVLAHRLALA